MEILTIYGDRWTLDRRAGVAREWMMHNVWQIETDIFDELNV